MQVSKTIEKEQRVTPQADTGIVQSRIAVVMPVYNEADTIEVTIREINRKMMRYLPKSSILIFEDGSRDNTKEKLHSLSREFPWVKCCTSPERKGYSRAVTDALLSLNENEFDYVAFMDSDGQYDPYDFFRLWRALGEERDGGDYSVDMVMARRLNRAEPAYRVLLSGGLRAFERILFSPPCSDVTSAFRIMRMRVAKSIGSEVKFSKYNFWLEFTARAAIEGVSIIEVPVKYRGREGSIGAGKSNVYSIKKMPLIVSSEMGALAKTWLEYNTRKHLQLHSRQRGLVAPVAKGTRHSDG